MNINAIFRSIATRISYLAGSPYTFITAIVLIILWATTGKYFGYSNTWQLAINTLTTIVTFLMVFLIQNTQNRDSKAIHLKLDELIKGVKGARDKIINIEDLPDEVIDEIHNEFQKLQMKYEIKIKEKSADTSQIRNLFSHFFKTLGKN
jgi:low affinity Fe/Cu permease